jgi:hypothetical protein
MRLHQNFLHVNGGLVSLSVSARTSLISNRGLVGPSRLWAKGSVYHDQIYALIGGAVAPVIVFVLARRWPRSWLRNIHIPVFLNGPLFCPPGSGINYGSWVLVGAYFQYYKRRKNFAWWSKVSLPSLRTC